MLQTMEDVNDVYQHEAEQEALLEKKKMKAEESKWERMRFSSLPVYTYYSYTKYFLYNKLIAWNVFSNIFLQKKCFFFKYLSKMDKW